MLITGKTEAVFLPIARLADRPGSQKVPASEWMRGPFALVRLKGFEPPTFWSVARRSIQLS